MKAIVFDVEFMWGFQARVSGQSKSPPSYPFPPLTTVLGALAMAYGRRTRRGEDSGVELMRELSRDLLALSFKPLNTLPLHFVDVSRVFAIGGRGGIRYPDPRDVYVYKSFDAPGRGSTILGSLDGEPPRVRYVLVLKDSSPLTLDDAWSIRRLGSRESLVCVTLAEEVPVRVTPKGETFSTSYATPLLEGIRVVEHGTVLRESCVSPYRLSTAPSVAYSAGESVLQLLIPLPHPDFKGWLEVEVESESYAVYEVQEPGSGSDRVVGLAG